MNLWKTHFFFLETRISHKLWWKVLLETLQGSFCYILFSKAFSCPLSLASAVISYLSYIYVLSILYIWLLLNLFLSLFSLLGAL